MALVALHTLAAHVMKAATVMIGAAHPCHLRRGTGYCPMLSCPPCPEDRDPCTCDEYRLLAEELAFPQLWDVECSDCGLRDGHTVPHMSDEELGRYDGQGAATQTAMAF